MRKIELDRQKQKDYKAESTYQLRDNILGQYVINDNATSS